MAICIFSLTKDVQDYFPVLILIPIPSAVCPPLAYSIFGRAAAAVNMQTGISFVALISVRFTGRGHGPGFIFNIMFNNLASSGRRGVAGRICMYIHS